MARSTMLIPVVVAAAGLLLAGCASGSSEPVAQDSTAAPSATVGEPAVEPDPSTPSAAVSEPADDTSEQNTPAAAADVDETSCFQIAFDYKKSWKNKGKSYESVWLKPNMTAVNNCDKKVKSFKIDFYVLDDFGDQWPEGMRGQNKVNLKPGEKWKQDSSYGYSYYSYNDNYTLVDQASMKELVTEIDSLTLAFGDGTTATGSEGVTIP